MPLPDLIEIVPLDKPVRAEITVPGSKSITNRALILAALAEGETVLRGALWSEDTQIMVECLQDLGFMVNVEPDPDEFCNRIITVYGRGGTIPPGGTAESPVELFVGNAGTAARFLAALVCLGNGTYRLHGVSRMHERPQAALFAALRELGYRVDSPNDKLPAVIHGQAWNAECGTRNCTVSVAESSQFASALLLCARQGGWKVEVNGANADELPYVEMTRRLVETFPNAGGEFQIEPDASSGSYFWAAGHARLVESSEYHSPDKKSHRHVVVTNLTVRVANWPKSGWQIDASFIDALGDLATTTRQFASEVMKLPESVVRGFIDHPNTDSPKVFSRATQLGDSIMTAVILAPLCSDVMKFTDLGRLRLQECERVVALRTELMKCGARVVEEGDMLTVYPSELHGAEIETYNDHRMAMCFAVLGLKVPGIQLRNPSCVKKTFPNFFQKLAAAPPQGLGVTILNARTGQRLSHDDLFAA